MIMANGESKHWLEVSDPDPTKAATRLLDLLDLRATHRVVTHRGWPPSATMCPRSGMGLQIRVKSDRHHLGRSDVGTELARLVQSLRERLHADGIPADDMTDVEVLETT